MPLDDSVAGLSISPIGAELLDDPSADAAVVAESLRNIARANKWFGGAAAIRFGLRRTLGKIEPGTELTLLDLGTGLGDLPRAAVHWGARRGLRLLPVGLEVNRAAAALAREQGLPVAVGCAGSVPLGDKSVDVVLVSQVAHHLAAESVVQLLRTCDRLARAAVIVGDLHRHPLAAPAFWIGGHLLGFDPVTLHDGVTSIKRGFSRSELLVLLRRAGVAGTVHRRPGFRLVATWAPA
jgi:2-polyprenyl-3-methyl-5-hydroxy-6-metoxy-1,4-benzoquinol methylase